LIAKIIKKVVTLRRYLARRKQIGELGKSYETEAMAAPRIYRGV
jgi:hypothetical protein